MKILYAFLFAFLIASYGLAQGVTIGTNNPADPSAILDVQSSSKGMLMPKLTTQARNAIVSPAAGLQIYNTTVNCVQIYMPQSGWRDWICDCLNPPSSAFTAPNIVTVNTPASFSATANGMTYSWTFASGNPATSTVQNPSVTWVNSGNHIVTLTVTDNTGCSSTTIDTITVSNCPPPGTTVVNFGFTGSLQTWTAPICASSVLIEVWGAQGSNGGGNGGYAKGTISVSPGQTLNIYVGGQTGYNGGGTGSTNKNGGGASDVRMNGTALTDRIIVGGGGGAAGGAGPGGTGGGGQACTDGAGGGFGTCSGCNPYGGPGTQGTCTSGGNAGNSSGGFTGGGGGGGLTGGGAGSSGGGYGAAGSPGVLGIGGNRGVNTGYSCDSGAGGGGGYYGGGGTGDGQCASGGGGGGSSWASSNLAGRLFTGGLQTGNGQIRITY